jgi:hypothetical protein
MKQVILCLTTALFCSGCLSNINQFATGNPRLKLHFQDQDNYQSGTWSLTDFPQTQRHDSGTIDLVIEIREGHSNYIYGSLEAKDFGFSQIPPEPYKRLTIHRNAGSLSLLSKAPKAHLGQGRSKCKLVLLSLIRSAKLPASQ